MHADAGATTIAADTTSLPDALLIALDGSGHGRALAPPAADEAVAAREPGFLWLQLRRDAEGTIGRLRALGLDAAIVDALLAEEPRPRCTVHGDGAVVVLRGVSGDVSAESAATVSVRLWIEAGRAIGVSRRPLRALNDLVAATDRGQGPRSVGDLVARLALRLAERTEPAVVALAERVDALEARVLRGDDAGARRALAALRRRVIALHGHALPQREAIETLRPEELDWLSERDLLRLAEAAERVARLAAELDAVRDRALVVRDELADASRERMNRTMLLLALVTTVFLPLGLVTGLLGMNVAGVPGASREGAFWIVVGVLLAVALLAVTLLARFGLLGRPRPPGRAARDE